MKTSSSKLMNSRVSFKYSRDLARIIKGKNVSRAKKLLEDLINQKRNLDGKYYTKNAKQLLGVLKSAEANAKNTNMNVERLFVKNAYANKAERRMLSKTRFRLRGRRGKSANIEIIVEER